ncbi:MAG: M13 family metallopeptidase [Pyrinomonadaceae bacterium]
MNNYLKSSIVFVLALAFLLSTTLGQTGGGHGLDLANLDPNTKPCQNFFQYANGGWLARNEIPAAYPSWGIAHELSERNRETVHQILEDAAKNTSAAKGSNEQKVGDYYASCMAEDKIEAAGVQPLAAELQRIAQVKDSRGLLGAVARLHTMGVNVMFGDGSQQDSKNAAEVIEALGQGGLSLPNRDYYFKDDDKSKMIRAEYLKHITNMFVLLGDDAAKAATAAQTVMNIETKLAEGSSTPVELRDPVANTHRMTLAQLQTLAPHFAWGDFFKQVGLDRKTDIDVNQPKFFQGLDQQLTAVPVADWQTYLRWQLLNGTASGLSAKFVDEDFNFKGRILQGTKENLPRWKRCVSATDRALGEALGEVYVKKAFPPEAKARALTMVRNLEAALKDDIGTLSWMSDATRKQAITKLDAFINKIGYPDKWRDYSKLEITRDSYIMNRLHANMFENTRDLAKIGRPVDKTEWGMTPPTVNAYYNPQINEIVFPAGILQPPFFDAQADDAVNYGAMGAVIGHEMTHGFDDQGAQFDAQGNLKNWWSEADLKNFKERAACVINQFSSFEVEPGLHENGNLVVGESIADLGGLLIAYAAYQKSMEGKPRPANIDGFTPEQRFFLAYARGWATKARPEYERLLANVDPHPLPRFRVNGPLSNLPQFAQAFNCQADDPMVRAEKDRCVIW